jgi:hypothetical protein
MKKYLFLLLVPFTFGQTEMLINYGEMFDYGIFVNDSLHNSWIDTVGTDDTTAAVTSKELTLKYQYDFLTISLKDTGATYDDSIMVEFTDPDQTAWYPVSYIKDSTMTNVTQPLVDDNSQHSFLVYVAPYYKIRIRMINTVAVENRVFYFTLQAARKAKLF